MSSRRMGRRETQTRAQQGSAGKRLALGLWVLLALGLAGCGNGTSGTGTPGTVAGAPPESLPPAPLAIIGTYTDNFGCVDTVTATTWTTTLDVPLGCGGVYHISQYSNAGEYFIAQNDLANTFNPSQWSRFDWATAASHLYYCQTAYAAASEAAALATPRADATNPASDGCPTLGAFSWTQLN